MIIPPPPPGNGRSKLFNPTWQLGKNTYDFSSVLQQTNTRLDVDDRIITRIPDDMADGEAPKLKFNFTVEFAFRDNDPEVQNDVIKHPGYEEPYDNKFAVLKVTRPNPTVNYHKANFYNFRTNVATNVDYGTVNVVFYDDASNRAHDIFDQYFTLLSPVFSWDIESRANTMDRHGFGDSSDAPPAMAGGAAVTPVNAPGKRTASLGELEARHGIIRYIKIYHEYFVKESGVNQSPVRRTTVYTYLNPKITSANMDELDMSQSAVTIVDLTFNYDSVFVIHKDSPITNSGEIIP